ncbi:MAG: sulfatase [Candidatus Levyibacteriota bacterium]
MFSKKRYKLLFTTGILVLVFAFLFLSTKFGILRAGLGLFQNQKNISCQQKIVCKDCNVILISTDGMRTDHTGIFGYKRNTTPNLDKLSKQGLLFTNFFAASYLTPVSEMAIHTGMYPTSNGLTDYNTYLPANIKTLAQILQTNGFTTNAIHSSPEFWNEFPAMKKSFSKGFDSYSSVTSRTVPQINGILDNLKNNSKNNFWWITVGSVHWPYGQTADDVYTDPNYNGILKDRPLDGPVILSIYKNKYYQGINNKTGYVALTDKDVQYIIDMYDNSLKQFDDFLGSLTTSLRKQGLMDKTIIVVESEKGEDLGEHGYFVHYDIYDTIVHTPLLIVAPNVTPGKINSMVSSVDILPTVLGLLGMEPPSQTQGKSVLPIVCGDEKDNRSTAFIERIPLWEEADIFVKEMKQYFGIIAGHGDRDYAIRTPDWKYIRRDAKNVLQRISLWKAITKDPNMTFPSEELYNIKTDPLEKNNIINKVPADTVNKLRQELNNYVQFATGKAPSNVERYQNIQEYF